MGIISTYVAGRLAVGAGREIIRSRQKEIPLSPKGGGGMCVADFALQGADIIVSTTNAAVSRAIRMWTLSDISHVILYVGGGRVIEAVAEGVVERSLAMALNDARLGVVYRYPGLTGTKALEVANYARQRVESGAGYDSRGAVCAGLRVNCGSKTDYFCSELIFSAYQSAGISLGSRRPGQAVPQDVVALFNSGKLEYKGHLKS